MSGIFSMPRGIYAESLDGDITKFSGTVTEATKDEVYEWLKRTDKNDSFSNRIRLEGIKNGKCKFISLCVGNSALSRFANEPLSTCSSSSTSSFSLSSSPSSSSSSSSSTSSFSSSFREKRPGYSKALPKIETPTSAKLDLLSKLLIPSMTPSPDLFPLDPLRRSSITHKSSSSDYIFALDVTEYGCGGVKGGGKEPINVASTSPGQVTFYYKNLQYVFAPNILGLYHAYENLVTNQLKMVGPGNHVIIITGFTT